MKSNYANYKMNLNFIRKHSEYLFILSQPIQGRCMRIDSIPMPFEDMKNYINKHIEETRDDNDILVDIVIAQHDKTNCAKCQKKGVIGGIFAHDIRYHQTMITDQYCDVCLLNNFFIIKMTSSIERGEK